MVDVGMGALCQGMNAGVGPSRSVDAHRFSCGLSKRPLQMILHGVAMGLALPSGERTAVIGDDQLEPFGHQSALRRFAGGASGL